MAKAKTTTRKSTTAKSTSAKSSAAKTGTSKSAAKSSAKTATKTRTTKTAKKSKVGDQEVVMDRRRSDRRATSAAKKATSKPEAVEEKQETTAAEEPKMERRAKVNRRRQIDPTTCERDYTNDEIEFMQALDAYKRTSGRMFPTCSEILEVIRDLGYSRGPAVDDQPEADEEAPEATAPAFSDEAPSVES